MKGSQIWTPYRALGFVTDDVPFAIQKRGRSNFVTVCIGPSYQIFDCDKLRLVFVGPNNPSLNRAVALHRDIVFTAAGPTIYGSVRGRQVSAWTNASTRGGADATLPCVTALLTFGEHLLSLSDDHVLRAWTIASEEPTGEVYGSVAIPPAFGACIMMHPATYLNKIVIAGSQGRMRIYNMRTMTMIHEFAGWDSAIRCVVQSPAVDVVGVGLTDGRIILHNLLYDKSVKSFKQEAPVTAISFRTDGPQHMVCCGSDGSASIWDLVGGALITLSKGMHEGPVVSAEFLAGEPLLVTSGTDNALKMFIFDQPDGSYRLLRSRSGHTAPPTALQFYEDGKQLLSAGMDRSLRMFSTIKDSISTELSQGSLLSKANALGISVEELRLPPITSMDSAPAKERRWDNIVTCHEGESVAYTWNYQNRALGKHKLQSEAAGHSPIRSIAISFCGNYAVLGAASGKISVYNIQSGKLRGFFGASKDGSIHRGAVCGLAVDHLNLTLMSASLDGCVKFWAFHPRLLVASVDIGSPITLMALHRDSSLLAVAADDLVVRVLDADTHKIVRRFEGHHNRITSLAFSPDSRWLVTSSMDTTLRVWDVPAGRCIDWVRMDKAVTALSFSPDGEYLATAHVGSRGVYLWANKNHFSTVVFRPLSQDPDIAEMPMSVVVGGEEGQDADLVTADEDTKAMEQESLAAMEEELQEKKEQLGEGLITFSDLPPTRWINLSRLDLIRERNKPIEPAKAPEAAPFFLPTLPSLPSAGTAGVAFDLSKVAKAEEDEPASRIINMGALGTKSAWLLAVEEGSAKRDYSRALEMIKGMTSSAVDLEIRSLSTADEIAVALDFVATEMASHRNYELMSSYANLIMKVHSAVITSADSSSAPALRGALARLTESQAGAWDALQALFQSNLCFVKYFRGASI